MVKVTHLDDAFSDIFELEASPEEGQSVQHKDQKRKMRKGVKKKRLKKLKNLKIFISALA